MRKRHASQYANFGSLHQAVIKSPPKVPLFSIFHSHIILPSAFRFSGVERNTLNTKFNYI